MTVVRGTSVVARTAAVVVVVVVAVVVEVAVAAVDFSRTVFDHVTLKRSDSGIVKLESYAKSDS